MKSIAFLLFLSFILIDCTGKKNEIDAGDATEKTLRWDQLGALLVERMDLQPNEKVLLLARPGRFDPLVEVLEQKISSGNARYLGTISITGQQPEAWSTPYTDAAQGLDQDALQAYLKAIDLGVMMPGPTPEDLVYGLIQENLKEGRGRTIHFHWSGAYALDGELMDPTEEIDQFYEKALLETDYAKLADNQRLFEQAIRSNSITVTTPDGTNISFSVGQRPVTKQDGNASKARAAQALNLIDREVEMPAGAVRVAPLEETVNGVIVFPDARWSGEQVSGLKLTFEKGKVVAVEAKLGLEAVQREMEEAGDAGSSFREFALGFNPKLTIPKTDPWIPYYGYGAGVVRLSLGDNTELGGQVSGGYVRWNFFTDATVKVGQEVWVENGRLKDL